MEELSQENKHLIEVQMTLYQYQTLAFVDYQSYRIQNIQDHFTNDQKIYSINNFLGINKLSISFNQSDQINEEQANLIGFGFSNLKLLKNLSITFNSPKCDYQLTYDRISSSFKELEFLESLVINAFGKDSIDENSAIKLGQNLKYLANLQLLSLQFNNKNEIGLKGAYSLSQGISHLIQLNNLQIQFGKDSNIGTDGFIELGKAISNLKKLNNLKLQVDCQKIDLSGFIQFRNQIRHLERLQNLTIDFNSPFHLYFIILLEDFDFKIDQISINSVYNILTNKSSSKGLKDLNLSIGYVEIGSQGCIGLSEAFKSMNSLESLKLFISQIKIGKEGAVELGKGISYLKQLKDILLDIDGQNDIQSEGAVKIIEGCSKAKELTSLNLTFDNNNIAQAGFYQLGIYLKEFKQILQMSLNLSNNQITNVGCVFIGEGLSMLKLLTQLNLVLCKNLIGTSGIIGLCQGLKELSQLNSLKIVLDYNEICGFGLIALGDALENKPNLKQLQISMKKNSFISKVSVEYLTSKLEGLINCYKLRIDLDSPYSAILISLINSLRYQNSQHLKFNFFQEFQFYVMNNYHNYCKKNEINLKICNQKNYKEAIELAILSEALSKLTNLKNLEFKFNDQEQIDDQVAGILGKSLSNLVNLENLKLKLGKELFLTNESTLNILSGIKDLKSLNYLRLDMKLSNCISQGLSLGLSNLQNIQNLQLQFYTEQLIPLKFQEELGQSISKIKNLQLLSIKILKKNEILCSKEIILAMNNLNQLKEIEIDVNLDCFITLEDQIKEMTNLDCMKLQIYKQNFMCDHKRFLNSEIPNKNFKAERFVQVFSHLQNIKQLTFQGTQLDLEYLNGDFLKNLSNLEQVQLEFTNINYLNSLQYQKMFNYLSNLKNLKSIDLFFNSISFKDLMLFYQKISSLFLLESIQLQFSSLSYRNLIEAQTLVGVLSSLLKATQNLKIFIVHDNIFSYNIVTRCLNKSKRLIKKVFRTNTQWF